MPRAKTQMPVEETIKEDVVKTNETKIDESVDDNVLDTVDSQFDDEPEVVVEQKDDSRFAQIKAKHPDATIVKIGSFYKVTH